MDIHYLNRITETIERDFSIHSSEKNKVFKKNFTLDSPFGGKKNLTIERHPKANIWKIDDGIRTPVIGIELDTLLLRSLYEKS